MNAFRFVSLAMVAGSFATMAGPGFAAVSAAEAEKLKSTLTPLGGEKAGNKDGTIPAWTGGYTTPIPGDSPTGRRADPFKGEKPLFSINAGNADKYADKLSDGQKALLKKYPEYRIDVYKTHRTAAAPQWVYDNTFKNATRAKMNGSLMSGAYGGIPFPVPQSGEEVLWNHNTRWRGSAWHSNSTQYLITADGRSVLTTDASADISMPYYSEKGSLQQFEQAGDGALYWKLRLLNVGPPIRAGEAIVGGTAIDGAKDAAWVYLAGQRRTRKLPNPCCDTPTPATAGVMSFDELYVWSGRSERFNWKLAGKKEMYIPYNGNLLLQPKTDQEVLSKTGLNPDFVRWELHRVWVVEATLKEGQRHQAAKSKYYCDEDTWMCVLGDRWTANGQLWKTLWLHNFVAPDLPGTIDGVFGFNDLQSGSAYVANLVNAKPAHYLFKSEIPDRVFSPDALAGEGVR